MLGYGASGMLRRSIQEAIRIWLEAWLQEGEVGREWVEEERPGRALACGYLWAEAKASKGEGEGAAGAVGRGLASSLPTAASCIPQTLP